MSSGFILGGTPLKLTTPLIAPAVEASTLMVAAFGAAVAGGSEAGWDLLQPDITYKARATTGRNTLIRFFNEVRLLAHMLTAQADHGQLSAAAARMESVPGNHS
jgi:hypothetical protein